MLAGAVAAGLVGAAAAAAYGVRAKGSQWFCESVSHGSPERRAIALTFDDGPSAGTLDLLDILSRHGARATFFQCGASVRRYPQIARAVLEGGHELGNHTDSHPLLCLRTPDNIRREIRRAQATIEEATGSRPKWFRPPYGVRWFGLRPALAENGLFTVMWSILGRDWMLPADGIVRRVQPKVRSGSIICLHDGREARPQADIQETVHAVRRLVPALQEEGYELVTLSQLLCRRK